MQRFSRRSALHGVGALGLGLAGCLDAPGGEPADTETPPNGEGENGDLSYDVHHLPRGADTRDVFTHDDGPGYVFLTDASHETNWLFRDGDYADAEAFVEGMDDDEVLLYVESVGPNTCHDRVELSGLRVEDGTLRGSATVVDTADPDEGCGDAVITPGVLARVGTDERPARAVIEVTDGWKSVGEVASDDPVHDPASLPGYVRPTGDPETAPERLDCDRDPFTRHFAGYDEVTYGEGDDPTFALRTWNLDADAEDREAATTVARGDEVAVTLTNLTNAHASTGNRGKYNFELSTEEGWIDVRGFERDGPLPYPDDLVSVHPGEVVTWRFEMTEAGIVADHQHEGDLVVCPELQPGRYRFVFHGVDDLAVAFDYVG